MPGKVLILVDGQARYQVTLSADERSELKKAISGKNCPKLRRKRAYLLIALDNAIEPLTSQRLIYVRDRHRGEDFVAWIAD